MKHIPLLPRVLVVGALALFAVSCVSPETHRQVVGANRALQAQRDEALDDLNKAARENERLQAEVARLSKNAQDANYIAEKKKQLEELLAKYQISSSTPYKDVEMVQTGEGLAFRVAGGVLFSSGSNVLTDTGKSKLDELVGDLRGRRVRIEGHTDKTPIVNSPWRTNLRLSVERAMSVADYLTGPAGLDAANISVAGYGQFRPAVEGDDPEALQKNRRVEILLLER